LIIKEQEAGEKAAEVCRRHALPGRALHSKVTRVGKRLRSLEDETGKPKELLAEQMLDNGRKFTSMAIQKWVQDTGIDWHNIAPGKPQQNGLIESCNGKFRTSHALKHALSGSG
jgi:transposase InsO family protein